MCIDQKSLIRMLYGDNFSLPLDFAPRPWQADNLIEFAQWIGTRKIDPDDPRCFLAVAGVGSGKTIAAAMMAVHALNSGIANRIVYVAPNRTIMRAVRSTFAKFGIDLDEWKNSRHPGGEDQLYHGVIATYATVARQPELQRRIIRKSGRKTMVILDEIHHLGDKLSWGSQAIEAFGCASVIVGLSGTPFRTDNRLIPFVEYEDLSADLKRYKHNFAYTLGAAVADGICRKPAFCWLEGDVEITRPFDRVEVRNFKDATQIDDETANLMLAGAVHHESELREGSLRRVMRKCAAEGRRLVIFLGGSSKSDTLATDDAIEKLPIQLERIGVPREKIVSVTGRDGKDARDKIAKAVASGATVIIAVNIISEGVDLPEFSAALFFSSVTTKQTTIQRIGRVLRMRSIDDPLPTALVFMFKDRRYLEYSVEIEKEIDREFLIREQGRSREESNNATSCHRRTIAIGIGQGRDSGITYNGLYFSEDQCESAREWCVQRGYPKSTHYLGLALEFLFGKGDAA